MMGTYHFNLQAIRKQLDGLENMYTEVCCFRFIIILFLNRCLFSSFFVMTYISDISCFCFFHLPLNVLNFIICNPLPQVLKLLGLRKFGRPGPERPGDVKGGIARRKM